MGFQQKRSQYISNINFKHESHEYNKRSYIKRWKYDDTQRLIASLFGSVSSFIVGHPMDSIKVAVQMESSNNVSLLYTIKNMYNNNGIKSFFRGISSPIMVKSLVWSTFFAINGYITEAVISTKTQIIPIYKVGLIGGLSGVILTPFVSIADLIKIQLQNDTNKIYTGFNNCVNSIVKHGVFLRGLSMTMITLPLSCFICTSIYTKWNRYFDNNSSLGNNNVINGVDTSLRVILGGSIAGIITSSIVFPFDTIKTQMQGQSLYNKSI